MTGSCYSQVFDLSTKKANLLFEKDQIHRKRRLNIFHRLANTF